MDEEFRMIDAEKRKKLKGFLEQAHPTYIFYPIASLEELAALSALNNESVKSRVEIIVLGLYNLRPKEVEERFGKAKIKFISYEGATQEYLNNIGREISNVAASAMA